jgi:sulfide:quinone oxidoreductase
MQALLVAGNMLVDIRCISAVSQYNGHGCCLLTVETGEIMLGEFAYGGKFWPGFPTFLIDGPKPSGAAWFLKKTMLPPIYWRGMLPGHEWLATPEKIVVP